MSIKETRFTVPAPDGFHLHGILWSAKSPSSPKGLIQVIHGTGEYSEEYRELASYFVDQGYHVACYDQRGHGDSGYKPGNPVTFAKASLNTLVEDEKVVCEYLNDTYPTLPYYIIGCSLGSFIGRLYLARPDSRKLAGGAMVGTTNLPKHLVVFTNLMLWADALGGKRYQATKNTNYIMYEVPSQRVEPRFNEASWLYADDAIASAVVEDERMALSMTNHTAQVLIEANDRTSKMKVAPQNKDMKLFVLLGENDPQTVTPKSQTETINIFNRSGAKSVRSKIYPGGRHDVLKDGIRYQVWKDILDWMEE